MNHKPLFRVMNFSVPNPGGNYLLMLDVWIKKIINIEQDIKNGTDRIKNQDELKQIMDGANKLRTEMNMKVHLAQIMILRFKDFIERGCVGIELETSDSEEKLNEVLTSFAEKKMVLVYDKAGFSIKNSPFCDSIQIDFPHRALEEEAYKNFFLYAHQLQSIAKGSLVPMFPKQVFQFLVQSHLKKILLLMHQYGLNFNGPFFDADGEAIASFINFGIHLESIDLVKIFIEELRLNAGDIVICDHHPLILAQEQLQYKSNYFGCGLMEIKTNPAAKKLEKIRSLARHNDLVMAYESRLFYYYFSLNVLKELPPNNINEYNKLLNFIKFGRNLIGIYCLEKDAILSMLGEGFSLHKNISESSMMLITNKEADMLCFYSSDDGIFAEITYPALLQKHEELKQKSQAKLGKNLALIGEEIFNQKYHALKSKILAIIGDQSTVNAQDVLAFFPTPNDYEFIKKLFLELTHRKMSSYTLNKLNETLAMIKSVTGHQHSLVIPLELQDDLSGIEQSDHNYYSLTSLQRVKDIARTQRLLNYLERMSTEYSPFQDTPLLVGLRHSNQKLVSKHLNFMSCSFIEADKMESGQILELISNNNFVLLDKTEFLQIGECNSEGFYQSSLLSQRLSEAKNRDGMALAATSHNGEYLQSLLAKLFLEKPFCQHDQYDFEGYSAMMIAVEYSNDLLKQEFLRLLKKCNFLNPKHKIRSGDTVYHILAKKEASFLPPTQDWVHDILNVDGENMIDFMISSEAQAFNDQGLSPIFESIQRFKMDEVFYLLKSSPDIHLIKNRQQENLLIFAIIHNLPALPLILPMFKRFDDLDCFGFSWLHHCARHNLLDTAKLIKTHILNLGLVFDINYPAHTPPVYQACSKEFLEWFLSHSELNLSFPGTRSPAMSVPIHLQILSQIDLIRTYRLFDADPDLIHVKYGPTDLTALDLWIVAIQAKHDDAIDFQTIGLPENAAKVAFWDQSVMFMEYIQKHIDLTGLDLGKFKTAHLLIEFALRFALIIPDETMRIHGGELIFYALEEFAYRYNCPNDDLARYEESVISFLKKVQCKYQLPLMSDEVSMCQSMEPLILKSNGLERIKRLIDHFSDLRPLLENAAFLKMAVVHQSSPWVDWILTTLEKTHRPDEAQKILQNMITDVVDKDSSAIDEALKSQSIRLSKKLWSNMTNKSIQTYVRRRLTAEGIIEFLVSSDFFGRKVPRIFLDVIKNSGSELFLEYFFSKYPKLRPELVSEEEIQSSLNLQFFLDAIQSHQAIDHLKIYRAKIYEPRLNMIFSEEHAILKLCQVACACITFEDGSKISGFKNWEQLFYIPSFLHHLFKSWDLVSDYFLQEQAYQFLAAMVQAALGSYDLNNRQRRQLSRYTEKIHVDQAFLRLSIKQLHQKLLGSVAMHPMVMDLALIKLLPCVDEVGHPKDFIEQIKYCDFDLSFPSQVKMNYKHLSDATWMNKLLSLSVFSNLAHLNDNLLLMTAIYFNHKGLFDQLLLLPNVQERLHEQVLFLAVRTQRQDMLEELLKLPHLAQFAHEKDFWCLKKAILHEDIDSFKLLIAQTWIQIKLKEQAFAFFECFMIEENQDKKNLLISILSYYPYYVHEFLIPRNIFYQSAPPSMNESWAQEEFFLPDFNRPQIDDFIMILPTRSLMAFSEIWWERFNAQSLDVVSVRFLARYLARMGDVLFLMQLLDCDHAIDVPCILQSPFFYCKLLGDAVDNRQSDMMEALMRYPHAPHGFLRSADDYRLLKSILAINTEIYDDLQRVALPDEYKEELNGIWRSNRALLTLILNDPVLFSKIHGMNNALFRWAIRLNQMDLLKQLLQSKEVRDLAGIFNHTALKKARFNRNADILQILLRIPSELTYACSFGGKSYYRSIKRLDHELSLQEEELTEEDWVLKQLTEAYLQEHDQQDLRVLSFQTGPATLFSRERSEPLSLDETPEAVSAHP